MSGLRSWSWFSRHRAPGPPQPGGRQHASQVPRPLSRLWDAPPLGLVLIHHHHFLLLSPVPHPAESAFSRRVESKAQNHFEETNSSSQNSSGECAP